MCSLRFSVLIDEDGDAHANLGSHQSKMTGSQTPDACVSTWRRASLRMWTSLWILIWKRNFLFFEPLYLGTLLPWLNWYTCMYIIHIYIYSHRHFDYSLGGSMIPCSLNCGLIWEKERFLMTCPLEWAFVRSRHIRDVTNSNVQILCTNSTSKHWLHLTEWLYQFPWLLWQHLLF